MTITHDIRDELLAALSRPTVSLERMEARENAIVAHWRITGRNVHGVPTLGIRPNGRRLDIEAVTIDSVVDGVSSSQTLLDLTQVAAQLGERAETA